MGSSATAVNLGACPTSIECISKAFERYALELSRHMTIQDVAVLVGIAEPVLPRHIACMVLRNHDELHFGLEHG